jgi:hypothetical protein
MQMIEPQYFWSIMFLVAAFAAGWELAHENAQAPGALSKPSWRRWPDRPLVSPPPVLEADWTIF